VANRKRYFIRREECWGGTYLWVVVDRDRSGTFRARCVDKRYRSEKTAKTNCERANEDWDRFLSKTTAPQS
jgi:hypothetical protein